MKQNVINKNIQKFLLIIPVLFLFSGCSDNSELDEVVIDERSHTVDEEKIEKNQSLVQDSFDKYKTAILNDKSSEAIKYVDSSTISYYDNILNLVKNGKKEEIQRSSIVDKMTIFMLREKATKQEIIDIKTGEDLFLYAIDNGMVGKDSVMHNTIGEVKISEDFATGNLLVNGKKTEIFFQFKKEENVWKLDLTALFPSTNIIFQQIIEENNSEEDEFIFMIIESVTNKKVTESVWDTVE